jgi:Flp pilus assembly protein TadD
LKKAIEVDPKNEHPYNGLGNAYRDLKDFVNAEKAYLDSIKVNPKYAFPYNGIAIVYANQNNST